MGNTLSDVDICNNALMRLGTNTILSFQDGTTAANACVQAYELSRDTLLRKHFWSFAIKRVALAASAIPAVFGPKNVFPLPADFLRVKELWQQSGDYHIEDGNLCTWASSPVNLVYISRPVGTGSFDPLFVETLILSIVCRIGPRILGEGFQLEQWVQQYNQALFSAQQADAQDSTPGDLDTSTFVYGRYDGGTASGWPGVTATGYWGW